MPQETPRPPACRWMHDRVNRFHATPGGEHFKNARKEMLLGLRALLDARIERVERLGHVSEAKKIEVE